tara:strand:- start:1618 stop:1986 length:369 start_codon:yes stop_codon:yes gene_type:complete
MAEVTTVEIGEREVTLSAPASLTVRHEIASCAGSNWRRSFGAALGACWRGVGRPKTKYAGCDYNPLKYGGEVIDELVARGEPMQDVLKAGGIAFGLISSELISESEVKAVEDFTEPMEGLTS